MLFEEKENIIPLEGEDMIYIPQFIPRDKARQYFDFFREKIQWQSGSIKIFGKTHEIPRLQAWYGDDEARYSYSNIDLEPLPWTNELQEIKAGVEAYSQGTYNSVLLNLYRNGRDSNGWHSDDEKELGLNPEIASVTLGQERVFHLKHKKKALKKSLLLESGSLLIMRGETQSNWKHQIPKSKRPLDARINLTFRRIFP